MDSDERVSPSPLYPSLPGPPLEFASPIPKRRSPSSPENSVKIGSALPNRHLPRSVTFGPTMYYPIRSYPDPPTHLYPTSSLRNSSVTNPFIPNPFVSIEPTQAPPDTEYVSMKDLTANDKTSPIYKNMTSDGEASQHIPLAPPHSVASTP